MKTVICSGIVHVPLPPARARELFTAEGERAWAPGWDPAASPFTAPPPVLATPRAPGGGAAPPATALKLKLVGASGPMSRVMS